MSAARYRLPLQTFPAGLAQFLERALLDRLGCIENLRQRALHLRRRRIADLDAGALGLGQQLGVLERCRERILQRLEPIAGNARRRDEWPDVDEVGKQEAQDAPGLLIAGEVHHERYAARRELGIALVRALETDADNAAREVVPAIHPRAVPAPAAQAVHLAALDR